MCTAGSQKKMKKPLDKTGNTVYTVYNVYIQNGWYHMNILISNASDRPIYDQIYTQIRGQILSGALEPGQALPSIRALAKDLRVSVITTKRAYDELEKEGYINTVPGKGCYVANQSPQLVREAYLTRIEEHLTQAAELAAGCGLGLEEVRDMLSFLWPGEND